MTLEKALDATRDEWNAYRSRYTPWPESISARREAIVERLRITRKRYVLCSPSDKRRAQLEREIRSDEQWLARNRL